MNVPKEIQQAMAEASHDASRCWEMICEESDEERSEMLAEKMQQTFGLLMMEENNSNVTMALIAFLSAHLMGVAEDAKMTEFGALLLLQTGLQRGIAAQVAVKMATKEAAEHKDKN
jgi:hypothetical protein